LATLKEVAQRAGVSSATVSKVLSNTPYVSTTTRERVLQAVDELGYTPHLAARALAAGRTYNIGVIFPFIYTSLFADVQVTTFLEGVEAAASERGYNILLSSPSMPVQDSELYRRFVGSHYFDGVLVQENLPDEILSSFIAQHGYPYVTVGYRSLNDTVNCIRLDDYGGAFTAARHLLDLGHRRIGIISVGPLPSFFLIERMRGYRDAFAASGLDLDAMPVAYGGYSIPSGETAMCQLLAVTDPYPTAVLCINDMMAFGAIRAARSEGLRVPEDISIVGFDDIPLAPYVDPPLTTVRQPSRDIGYRGAAMLFDLIERKQPAYETIIVPTSMIVRGSTRPIV